MRTGTWATGLPARSATAAVTRRLSFDAAHDSALSPTSRRVGARGVGGGPPPREVATADGGGSGGGPRGGLGGGVGGGAKGGPGYSPAANPAEAPLLLLPGRPPPRHIHLDLVATELGPLGN